MVSGGAGGIEYIWNYMPETNGVVYEFMYEYYTERRGNTWTNR